MKINREVIIDGQVINKEIELTGIELERCYNEYVAVHDRNEVIRQLKDREYENIDGIPEELLDDIVSKVREKMDNFIDDAVISTIDENEERLEPYRMTLKVFEYELERITRKTICVAAYSEESANEYMENKFGCDEYAFDDELDGEDSDYNYGSAYEISGNPEYADYNAEEDK